MRAVCQITPITPRKLVTLNPKLKSNRRQTLPTSFPLVGCHRKQLGLKTSLPKSQDAVALQQIERGALPMIDRGDIRQAIDRCSNLGLHCRALVMVSSSISWQPDCKIQRSGRNGQRDWCMSEVTAIISALVICIIVCLSWAVNHYRDRAITYKAQRDKNARELSAANAAITDMQMRQRDICCARCKNHEGVSWC